MARRSQCSSAGDNPLDPNYLPQHYREEYRLAIDSLLEENLEGYYEFLKRADVVDFLSTPEIQYIQNSVQVPRQSNYPEHPFLGDNEGDGSSDTYWPIHSDLDAPGLDLGWPQMHHFGGPTEVTTLVNPPEPDMPSIKEQTRRLIKNAQQVIAIVMDMFTDVDIFADLLNAAMRNVAVYILLDEQNAHHFINMVSNCRVNLQSVQLLRVRTVPGITYHCRSGKSFKGQMMDRFLLTDCRAVLSGNYSYMWSFEKLHRCMAHLFLGQLVSTFDEEFRILYAQSQPLSTENIPVPMEDFGHPQKRQYPSKKTLFREPRKFLPPDTANQDEWERHSYDERMTTDWRMMPLKRPEFLPGDMFGRFPTQQSRMDPQFDQGHSRLPVMENQAMKRHSYAEGVPGRYSYPSLQQQGLQDLDTRGRQFHRGQQPNMGPGPEADYSGYDKSWNPDYHSADQFSEPGLPQEMEPPDNFDPVLNYLSSTRNVDFDQDLDKLQPAADLPFSSPHARRLSAGQAYVCQTSPTPSNATDEKLFYQEPIPDRKDPMVKRGLRNWRISSYLSAYDNPGDEGLPSTPPQASDPFEEPSNPIQQTGVDISVPKIPNVREFKVPALPRASQMQSYVKMTAREQGRKEESTAVSAETKTTPTPSESSSTTEGDKPEEAEQKETNPALLRREESFRRKYNVALPRSSRLRSSLIFSSLEQHTSQDSRTAAGQQDEEGDNEQNKSYVSSVLAPKKLGSKEPFEWSRYIKSATFDNSAPETSKADDGTSKAEETSSSNKENANDPLESLKPPEADQANVSPSMLRVEPPVQPIKSIQVDMSDPDNRLMFFKELAAKRKAAKAAEAERGTEKTQMKQTTDLKNNITVQKEEPVPNETSERKADTSTPKSEGSSVKNVTAEDVGQTKVTEACPDVSDKTGSQDSQVTNDPETSQSPESVQTSVSTDSEKIELRNVQSAASLPVHAEPEAPQSDSPEEPKLPKPTVNEFSPSPSPTDTKETSANVPSIEQGTDNSESPTLHSTSEESSSLTLRSVDSTTSAASSTLNSNTKNPDSSQLETNIPSSPQPSESNAGTQNAGSSPSHPAAQSSESTLPISTKSDVTHGKCATGSGPNTEGTSCSPSLESESSSDPVAEQSEASSSVTLASPQDDKADSTPPDCSPSSPESCLPYISGLERSNSEPDQKEPSTPASPQAEPPPKHSQSETISLVNPDITVNACPTETIASLHDEPTQSASPSELILTGSGAPTPAETVSCSTPPSESCLISPEAEITESNVPLLDGSSGADSLTSESPTESNQAPMHPLSDSSSGPTETSSIVTTEPGLPSKTPTDNSDIGNQTEESKEPKSPEPGENESEDKVNKTTKQESVSSENTSDQAGKTNCSKEIATDEVVPLSPQSKQPKSGQSRYHSSTANVLSSSNLRDDTKLLLEQISANSHNRTESSKEAPVTDDEKEDEADKNAKREKERGIGLSSRGQPKSTQEREKLLEKIQSMRKERKVYSRFEMAP